MLSLQQVQSPKTLYLGNHSFHSETVCLGRDTALRNVLNKERSGTCILVISNKNGHGYSILMPDYLFQYSLTSISVRIS